MLHEFVQRCLENSYFKNACFSSTLAKILYFSTLKVGYIGSKVLRNKCILFNAII
jgi:hypothetical protein